ncbi:ubiquitin-conjugating enzyme E2 J1 [Aspergillus udagawae]|uniref:Ubiquitin-conjugating enzyme E2 J1 n=1 Tax=Aspergillus udagawae TaxID=91492 RepID=A0A8H3RPK5_9EURO|nr:ubiquitin-conjugating enzyme E2 J1 [Aspergillus udagawae]
MASPSHRRLLKEASELASHPSPHFTAHPVSDSNLYDWHFTLAGPPPPSPYAGGIYHGRIVLPPTYPLRPPSFRFLTPSGRFEVNREICLSISGHHEETWQPAWGIRTALLALRTFMDADAKGQVGGLDVDVSVRRQYAAESRGWVCDGCEGGRSNEEVLREWREVCRAKGVAVDDDDDDEVQGAAANESTASVEAEAKSEPEREREPSDTNANTEMASSEQKSESLGPSRVGVSPQQQVQVPVPVPVLPASAEAAAPSPAPTRTTPVQTTTTSRPTTTSDAPWLDRAILGVLVALAFMIVRRLAKSEEY